MVGDGMRHVSGWMCEWVSGRVGLTGGGSAGLIEPGMFKSNKK